VRHIVRVPVTALLAALVAALVALLAGCTLRVAPPATDARITRFVDDHIVVWNPTAARPDVLFVHFPGSFGVPDNSEFVLREVAASGTPAIGLRYPNDWTVQSLCRQHGVDCPGAVRDEIVNGVDRSPLVSIDRANSITNRLAKLLAYLDAAQPKYGWDAYLDGGAPRWERIIVSGHSQGAGHAAFISTQHRVARVVMFGGGTDRVAGQLASWVAPGATQGTRYFGFVHADDNAVGKVAGWRQLGATGEPTVVDGAAPPYAGAHMLVTDIATANPHGSVVTDRATPKRADGTPVFAPVWRHLSDLDQG
jgi:hypothetical protein